MSLGPVMLDLEGVEMTPGEREVLLHPMVGGVILFTRNYQSPEQLTRLIETIHQLRRPHLLVAVDHEGGRVQRFREGFTQLPPVGELGDLYDREPEQAKKMSETCGWLMAIELRAVGVDFSFAPVLDMGRNISDVIGDRAFHKDPAIIAELAQSYMHGMHRAGMAATGKHFPGHGSVKADSHIDMPVDERRFEDIYNEDVVPFERMTRYGLAGIMPAHVIYSAVDPNPAGFSSFWLNEVLRQRLGFQGVIFSDDLSMQAASVAGGVVDRADMALRAGCDMALVCNAPHAAIKVIDELQVEDDPVAHVRLARMHGQHFVNRAKLVKDPGWRKAVTAVEKFAEGDSLELEME